MGDSPVHFSEVTSWPEISKAWPKGSFSARFRVEPMYHRMLMNDNYAYISTAKIV